MEFNRLLFFRIYRYFLKKAGAINPTTKLEAIQDIIAKLKEDIDKLSVQNLFDQPTVKQSAIQNQIAQWEAIASNPDL